MYKAFVFIGIYTYAPNFLTFELGGSAVKLLTEVASYGGLNSEQLTISPIEYFQ